MFGKEKTMSTSKYAARASLIVLVLMTIITTSLFSLVHSFASSHQQIHGTKIEFGFSMNLIHRDHPESPFYNPNLTKSERIKAAIQRSHSRSVYLQSLSRQKITPNEIQSQVTPDHGLYVMNFSIGSPPVRTFAAADTASEIIWLQCLPCFECHKQKLPIFDPSQSSTYAVLGCEDELCKLTTRATCNQSAHTCAYSVDYSDGSYSDGNLSLDTLTFSHDGLSGEIKLSNMVFGCGHKNHQTPPGLINPPGMIGLNQKALSFIKQLQLQQFSYCLVEDGAERSSTMHFGSKALIKGGTTPILLDGRFMDDSYYLFLDGISVGSTRLPTSQGFFNMTPDGDGGFMVDSGTDYTRLHSDANDMLIEEMKNQIKNLMPGVDPLGGFAPCYNTTFDVIKGVAPDLTLHFSGLDLVLKKANTWVDVGQGNVCLAILPAFTNLTIFGNFQQQNMNVAFDLNKKFASFMNMEDCNNF